MKKIEAIKVTKVEYAHSEMIACVNYIVEHSFDAKNRYHLYLRDFYETLVILTNFTDYKSDKKDNELVDEVMSIRNCGEWDFIEGRISDVVAKLHQYVDVEIQELTKPFAKINNLLESLNDVLAKASDLATAITKDGYTQDDIQKIAENFGKLRLVGKDEIVEDVDSNENN